MLQKNAYIKFKIIKKIFSILILIISLKLYIKNGEMKIRTFTDFLNQKPNPVLILEFENYHLECLPGFSKYFIDSGHKIDILIPKNLSESMEKFEPKRKFHLYEFENLHEILRNVNLKKNCNCIKIFF